MANPKADEWARFSETLEEFQNNQSYLSGDIIGSQSSPQASVSPYMVASPYMVSSPYVVASPMR